MCENQPRRILDGPPCHMIMVAYQISEQQAHCTASVQHFLNPHSAAPPLRANSPPQRQGWITGRAANVVDDDVAAIVGDDNVVVLCFTGLMQVFEHYVDLSLQQRARISIVIDEKVP